MIPGDAPEWLGGFLAASYFSRCPSHGSSARAGCNFFCVECSSSIGSTKSPAISTICALCVQEEHSGHTLLQVRKCSGHHAVRLDDVRQLLEMEGIQVYVINCAKVVFLNGRPQAKPRKDYPHRCRACERSLMDASRFCSIACKLAPSSPQGVLSPGSSPGEGSGPGSAGCDRSDEDDRMVHPGENEGRGEYPEEPQYPKQEEQDRLNGSELAPSLDHALSPDEGLSTPLNSPLSGGGFKQQRRVRTKGRRRSTGRSLSSYLHSLNQTGESTAYLECEPQGQNFMQLGGDSKVEPEHGEGAHGLGLSCTGIESKHLLMEEDASELLCHPGVLGAAHDVSPHTGGPLTGWQEGFLLGQKQGIGAVGAAAMIPCGALVLESGMQEEDDGEGLDIPPSKHKRKISQVPEQQHQQQGWSDEGLGFLDLGHPEEISLEHGLLVEAWSRGKLWQETPAVGGLGAELAEVSFHALTPPFEFEAVGDEAVKRAGSEGPAVCGDVSSCAQEASASY